MSYPVALGLSCSLERGQLAHFAAPQPQAGLVHLLLGGHDKSPAIHVKQGLRTLPKVDWLSKKISTQAPWQGYKFILPNTLYCKVVYILLLYSFSYQGMKEIVKF